jgi:hypothetical protein
MGKAETLRSLRTDATANSINDNDSDRTVSAIPRLLLEKLGALEKRLIGLEAQVEQQEQTGDAGYGPLGCINQRTDQPGAQTDSFLGDVGLLF